MRVTNQESYGARKLRFMLFGTAGFLALAGACFVLGRIETGYLSIAGYVFSAAILSGLPPLVYAALNWGDGERGEARALDALKPLGHEYTAVTNVVIPGTKQGDIDLVLCGPFGAMAIEVKNYAARYVCEDDKWFHVKDNGYRQKTKSASRQAKKNAAVLAKLLKAQGNPAHVYGVVVLNPKANLTVNGSCVPVLTYPQLLEYVRGLPAGIAADPALVPLASPNLR